MGRVTFSFRHTDPAREAATIYGCLRAKLGREPSHAELRADVERIMAEAAIDRAERPRS